MPKEPTPHPVETPQDPEQPEPARTPQRDPIDPPVEEPGDPRRPGISDPPLPGFEDPQPPKTARFLRAAQRNVELAAFSSAYLLLTGTLILA